jgi:hypothetical protein
LLAVLYDEQRDRRYAFLGAFVLGLGLSNHQTVLFTAVPLIVWCAWRGWKDWVQPRRALLLVGALLAGLAPYLYLPIQAHHGSPVSWGEPDTWSGFWTHVLRREYGTFQLAPSGVAQPAEERSVAIACGLTLLQQVGWWGVPLAATGIAVSLQGWKERPLLAVLLVAPALSALVIASLGNLPVTDSLHREIVARFWQQPFLYVALLGGLGVAAAEAWLPHGLFVTVVVAVAGLPPMLRLSAMDRHENRIVRSYGEEILRAAPQGALLFTRGDLITNTVRYLQATEGQREDVHVIDLELLGLPWEGPRHPEITLLAARYMPGAPDGFTMIQLLDANFGRAPILLCGGPKTGDASSDGTYGRWPYGFCEAVHRGTEAVNIEEWLAQSEAALPRIDFGREARPDGSWEDVGWKDYWEVRQNRGAHLLQVAGSEPRLQRYIGVAARILLEVVHENPDVPGHVYRNLAVALGREGLDTPERREATQAAWLMYLQSAPADDPQIPAIMQEVARLAGK